MRVAAIIALLAIMVIVSGQAGFRRVCRAREAVGPQGWRLTAKERRSLWRTHARRTSRETGRCC